MATGPYARKKGTVYFSFGTKPVSRPYVSKSGRLILGSDKRKKRGRKTKGNQRRGWVQLATIALPHAVDAIKSIFK